MGKLIIGPGVVPGNPRVFNAISNVVATLPYDYVVTSWLRPGATVQGTSRRSNHANGDALDVKPLGAQTAGESPCGGSKLDEESTRRNTILVNAINQQLPNRGTSEPVIWLSCTGGNHYDHAHVAVLNFKAGSKMVPTTPKQMGGCLLPIAIITLIAIKLTQLIM